MKKHFIKCIAAIALAVCVSAVSAQTRTTPVTVQNTPSVSIFNVPTVKFDPTGNMVQSQQSGAWTVGINPAQNTVNAVATQAGTWNVGITGTPMVKANYSKVTLFAGYNAVLAYNERVDTLPIDCRGFKEMRIIINYDGMGLIVGVSAKGPGGDSYYDLGHYPVRVLCSRGQ